MANPYGPGGPPFVPLRGSRKRLGRIKMRGNGSATVWFLFAFALLLLLVDILWVPR